MKMKRLRPEKRWVGKFDDYLVEIKTVESRISAYSNSYFFTIQKVDDTYSYSSLWDEVIFATYIECLRGLEQFMFELYSNE